MHSPPSSSSSRKKPKPIGKGEEEAEEEETVLVALIEHRTKEVDHLRHRVTYYTSQLQQTERRLNDSKHKLALLRSKQSAASPEAGFINGTTDVKTERRSTSPIGTSEDFFSCSLPPKPKLCISAPIPHDPQPPSFSGSGSKPSAGFGAPPISSTLLHQSPNPSIVKEENPRRRSSLHDSEAIQDRGTKRKFGNAHMLTTLASYFRLLSYLYNCIWTQKAWIFFFLSASPILFQNIKNTGN